MRAGRRVPSPHRCIGCFQSAIFVNFRHMCKPMHQLSAACSPRRWLDSPSEGERGAHPSLFFHGRKGFFPPVEHKLSSRRKVRFPPLGKINYPSAEPFRLLSRRDTAHAVMVPHASLRVSCHSAASPLIPLIKSLCEQLSALDQHSNQQTDEEDEKSPTPLIQGA